MVRTKDVDADITIIGAGVVGLAIAAGLSNSNRNLYVLEKGKSYGTGISSRNSEVIHAGIYAPPGTLKSTLCAQGRDMLYEILAKNSIPHNRIGKLIIAASDAELKDIEKLHDNALKNGISSVSLITRDAVTRMEPNITAFGALLSPDSGILSVHALMDYFFQHAVNQGAQVVCGTEVVGIEPCSGGYKISTINLENERFELRTERVINAAGLYSDTIARMIGMDYQLHYCKGDYFGIADSKRGLVKHLVYPVPEKNNVGLGVHLTLDLNGHMKLGPDAVYITRSEDYRVDEEKGSRFYESASKFLPFISRQDVTAEMAGIRPKLQGPNDGIKDFVIKEDAPGFINLIGIESPGLTASPAIARYVENMLK